MNYMTEDAHRLMRKLDIQADSLSTTMNVVENLTDGKAHFGVIQLDGTPVDYISTETWKKPLTEVDEDYIGTFNITKIMDLESLSTDEEMTEDDWLPCCSQYGGNGGWYDMNPSDKEGL